MTRKRYETQADRDREMLVAVKWAERFKNVGISKLPGENVADFLVTRGGKDAALLEIKTRTCNVNDYRTYHVSKSKLVRLKKEAESKGLIPILLVQWKDKAGYVDVNNYLDNCMFTEGGRWDRGDKHDVEIMAEAPIYLFKLF